MRIDTTVPHGFDAEHDSFRGELASVHKDGRRKWVYARQPSGRFYTARTLVSYVLLALLFLGPFVKLHGQPILLLNVLERKFIVFGLVFWPQDFYLLVLCVLTGFVTIALLTSAVGRVWCGWMCPQTIFLEMLFRKIEWLIEGSAQQQVRRDKAPLTADTAWRKALKHAVFFALSFLIANVFLAYIISADALWAIVTAPPREHVAGLFAISVFSLVFYAVFARFREQACTLACPYGRVMGALVDEHTITITYDRTRGEPRGKLGRGVQDVPRGDCIDCGQCVTVCPTGIDIRNGIQLECVACTACADACDDVMRRVSRPQGLIRYTSEEAVRTGRRERPELARQGLRGRVAGPVRRGGDVDRQASRSGRADPAPARHAADDARQRRRVEFLQPAGTQSVQQGLHADVPGGATRRRQHHAAGVDRRRAAVRAGAEPIPVAPAGNGRDGHQHARAHRGE